MSAHQNYPEDKTHWQKYAWLWFISALPAAAVIASLITVFIAVKNPPSMVNDDYYKAGLSINKEIQQDLLAERLNIQATLIVNLDENSLKLLINKDQSTTPELLMLSFIHPVDSNYDFQLPFQKNTNKAYLQQFQSITPTNWHIRLSPINLDANQTWRVRGRLNFPQQGMTELKSHTYGH